MPYLFEYVDLLEYFPPRVLVFDVGLVDRLYSYFLAGQLVNAQCDFPEGALS